MEYAKNLQDGFYFDAHNFWYFTYSLFIYFLHFVNSNILFIVISQYAIGLLAVFSLYKTYMLLFNDNIGAFLTGLTYILFAELTTWNSYILCESLFCSLTCISLYLLTRLHKQHYSPLSICITFFTLSLTVLTKPTGIALLGALCILFIYKNWNNSPSLVFKIFFSSILIFCILLLVNQMLTTFLLVENYITGDIVYAASTIKNMHNIHWIVLTPPKNLYIPTNDHQPIIRLILFITHNFVFWIQLFLLKITYFISHIRPYWSWKHNLFSSIFLYPFYYFAIKFLTNTNVNKELRIFALSYIFLHTTIIGVTSVDWDGRFLMPLLPIFFLLGTHSFLQLLNSRNNY